MFNIEITTETSAEEETEALREELDFDYIRECVSELKRIVDTYGPFKEVKEKTAETVKGELARTYDNKRGWICDELENVNSKNIWTYFNDPINNYSYLVAGYHYTKAGDSPSRHEIQSWFISEKPFEEDVEFFSLNTEFLINVTYADDDEDTGYWILDLWYLIEEDEVSDEDILGSLAN